MNMKPNLGLSPKTTEKARESVRSMVEMLGTLAIVGVLSIGRIAGYSYGIDKYRTNQIINDIMLRAVDINAQLETAVKKLANNNNW